MERNIIWNDNIRQGNFKLYFDDIDPEKPEKIVLKKTTEDRQPPVKIWEFEMVDKQYVDDADAYLQMQIDIINEEISDDYCKLIETSIPFEYFADNHGTYLVDCGLNIETETGLVNVPVKGVMLVTIDENDVMKRVARLEKTDIGITGFASLVVSYIDDVMTVYGLVDRNFKTVSEDFAEVEHFFVQRLDDDERWTLEQIENLRIEMTTYIDTKIGETVHYIDDEIGKVTQLINDARYVNYTFTLSFPGAYRRLPYKGNVQAEVTMEYFVGEESHTAVFTSNIKAPSDYYSNEQGEQMVPISFSKVINTGERADVIFLGITGFMRWVNSEVLGAEILSPILNVLVKEEISADFSINNIPAVKYYSTNNFYPMRSGIIVDAGENDYFRTNLKYTAVNGLCKCVVSIIPKQPLGDEIYFSTELGLASPVFDFPIRFLSSGPVDGTLVETVSKDGMISLLNGSGVETLFHYKVSLHPPFEHYFPSIMFIRLRTTHLDSSAKLTPYPDSMVLTFDVPYYQYVTSAP